MLKGRSAIITGSTSGIGLGIAHVLAYSGCNIMLNGFGEQSVIDAIKSKLTTKYQVSVGYSKADMSKSDQIVAMFEQCEKELSTVDILINNAGIQYVSPIDQFPVEKWDQIIAINLSAAFHAIKAAIPIMKKNKFGRIINIASAHGLVGSPNKSAYIAAKHGIVGLTKSVALELAELNITCNAICPGWVHTALVQKQIEDRAKAENITIEKAEHDLLFEKQPSLKFVQVEEIGETTKFLCSEGAKSITGIALPIDGGWTAR